ncbi:TPA: hypothetical protein ROY30_005616 [Bacillus cereus]|uniref:hypothetical protein n=1 Tax=Bacillales TaxID=1385 RepID=UPI001C2F68E9|nr:MULTISPECIES: hypothetical protein [Bacillales]MCP1284051.1 hypothetical protein [Bacillus sp. S0635]MCQ6349897.1 hypothetical protein [Bacillus cereus]HDX9631846.1 hypothetical protein [Bacillus cereus]
MDIELVLKSLVPFGSALLGGYITYSMSRAKEKKEVAKKQLESVFELQKINFKLLGMFNELKISLHRHAFSDVQTEEYSGKIVADKIQKCLNEWIELNVASLAHAVNMEKGIFELVKKTHDEATVHFMPVTKAENVVIKGMTRIYSEKNISSLETVYDKIEHLQTALMEQEKVYVERYMKKYNKHL